MKKQFLTFLLIVVAFLAGQMFPGMLPLTRHQVGELLANRLKHEHPAATFDQMAQIRHSGSYDYGSRWKALQAYYRAKHDLMYPSPTLTQQ
jgi:hypothetical protein